jgi:hypothetical protein
VEKSIKETLSIKNIAHSYVQNHKDAGKTIIDLMDIQTQMIDI